MCDGTATQDALLLENSTQDVFIRMGILLADLWALVNCNLFRVSCKAGEETVQ